MRVLRFAVSGQNKIGRELTLLTLIQPTVIHRGRGRGEYHPATTPYPPMQEPVPIHSATSIFPCLPIPAPRPLFLKFHLRFRLHLQEFMPVPRHFRVRVPLNDISQSFTRRWNDRPKDKSSYKELLHHF